jgi:hypothetical protein
MLDKNTKGIIAEGCPRGTKDQIENPLVRKFNRGKT